MKLTCLRSVSFMDSMKPEVSTMRETLTVSATLIETRQAELRPRPNGVGSLHEPDGLRRRMSNADEPKVVEAPGVWCEKHKYWTGCDKCPACFDEARFPDVPADHGHQRPQG